MKHHENIRIIPGKMAALGFCMFILIMLLSYADSCTDHVGHAGYRVVAQPYDSGYVGDPPIVQENVVIKVFEKHNHTCNEAIWTIKETVSAGKPAKVVADDEAKTKVNNQNSDLDTHTWTVTDQMTIPAGKCYRYEAMADLMECPEQVRYQADLEWKCDTCYPGQCFLQGYTRSCINAANSSKEHTGVFSQIHTFSQNTDPDGNGDKS